MKTYIKPVLTGISAALIMLLVMLKVTMNFQILLFLGSAIFLLAAYLNSGSGINYLLNATTVLVFYLSFFVIVVLSELPELWYFIPVYIASALLGSKLRAHKRTVMSGTIILTIAMFLIAFKAIPTDLENRLTKERFEQLPEFVIQDINGQMINSKSLAGKVVVLDFFGTWCRPCILELKELDEIRKRFDKEEVVFYIINADQGGDTPEKFEAFIRKNDYSFHFAYDHDSKVFKQLEMYEYGLPSLLIIDKEQNIRLQHVGYNAAETNFRESIGQLIESLR